MARKLIIIGVTAFLLLNSVTFSMADTSVTGQTSTDTQTTTQNTVVSSNSIPEAPESLTLNEAFDFALKNNIEVLKANYDYEQAIIDSEQAQYSGHDISADSVKSLQQAQTKYVSPEQKKLAEDVAKQENEITKEQTKISVEKCYYDVLKAQKIVSVNQATVQHAQEQLNLVQNKYKAGTAVKTDVNKAEISLANAKADLANAQRDLKTAQVTFNKTIGTDVNATIKLTEDMKYEKITLPTVDDLTKEALTNRLEIKKAANTVTIAELNYNVALRFLSPNTYTVRSYITQLEQAKLDLIQQQQNVKADVISSLFQVQKDDEVVNISAKSLEQAKENQTLARRRYQIGVGTFSDLLSSTVDLAQAEENYIEAVYNFTLAKDQLKTVTLVGN